MHTCSECTFMNFESEHNNDGKFWCTRRLDWFTPQTAECDRYCKDYHRSEADARSYREYGEKKQSFSSPCFITTIVCDTLGMDDNNIYLNILRKFRKEYLQKRPDGISILEEYDTIGPVIAHCINNDEKKMEVAQGVFSSSIFPVVNDICEGKNASAIRKYASMTEDLIHRYGLETLTLSVPGVSAYDYKQDRSSMGHGQLVKKK